MKHIGYLLILCGILLVLMGAGLILSDRIANIPGIGRFPGDIKIEGKNYLFYFPITTCIIISIVLTLLLNIIVKILK